VLSTLLVGSSRRTILLFLDANSHLANASLCFSHQDKFTHFSLIFVLIQFGNLLITFSNQAI